MNKSNNDISTNSKNVYYYFLVLSNLIASLGGGTILGKGMSIISLPLVRGGALQAILIGSALGFIFVNIVKSIKVKAMPALLRSFSLFCAITSLVLFFIFHKYSVHEKLLIISVEWAFFAILCLHFMFWYYARAWRVQEVVSKGQNMALIDFGYYVGFIIGSILYVFPSEIFKIVNIGMGIVLLIDVLLQIFSWIFDLVAHKDPTKNLISKVGQCVPIGVDFKRSFFGISTLWGWKLSISTAILVIAVQSTFFNLTHYFNDRFSPFIVAFFYVGAALAAWFSNKYSIVLEWKKKCDIDKMSYAVFNIKINGNQKAISLRRVCSILALSVISSVYITNHGIEIGMNNLNVLFKILFLSLSMLSGFAIEFIVISIINRLGIEEIQTQKVIAFTYGIMVVGLAIGFFVIGLFNNLMFVSISVVGICLLLIMMILNKRSQIISSAAIENK